MLGSGLGSDEEEEIDMMAVEGSDGQQYVVLEVIQLADGEEPTMVMAGEGTDTSIVGLDGVMQNSGKCGSFFLVIMPFIGVCIELDDDVIKALQSARRIKVEDEKKPIITNAETDMQNCFGFDVSGSITYKVSVSH